MKKKRQIANSISLETVYCFNKTYFDEELTIRAKKFIEDFKALHALDYKEHLPKLDKCLERLDNKKFNNLYDFLESLLKNVFKTKNEREMFFNLVENYFIQDKEQKLINLNDQTEEFDM